MTADLTGFELAPERTVCLVVNMQNDFCQPDGGQYEPEYAACVEPIRKMLERTRAVGIPTIFVRAVREVDDPAVLIWEAPAVPQGSGSAEFVEALTPGHDDHVVAAARADPFHGTELDLLLAKLLPEPTSSHVIVMGLRSNFEHCHAVDGVHLRDYWTLVPLDCIAGSPGLHEEMFDYYNPLQLWNVFQTRSDLIRFRTDGGPGQKLAPREGPGRILQVAEGST